MTETRPPDGPDPLLSPADPAAAPPAGEAGPAAAPAPGTMAPKTMAPDTTQRGAWRLRDLALVVALGLIFSAGVRLAFPRSADGDGFAVALPTSGRELVFAALLSLANLAAIAIVVARRRKPDRPALGLGAPSGRWVGIAAGIVAGLFAVKVSLALAFSMILTGPESVTVEIDGLAGWLLVGNLAVMGLLVGVEEEALYRGVLYGWLRGVVGVPFAILLSAVVFGVVHKPAATGVVTAFAAGVALAWLYERSGSLWPGIAVHAANNASSLLVLAVWLV